MHPLLLHGLLAMGSTFGVVLTMALLLSFGLGRLLSPAITRAPALDLVVALLTWAPWVAAIACVGWIGWPGAIVGQFFALIVWCSIHEMANRPAARGPRIIKFINRTVGRWQNHVALWVTVVALPAFWLIRIMEMGLYWLLPALLGFPKYKQGEWINVSRHKFDGLVGHDLIWCLYCDWMTGVYSLGAEMLRNVESFWCPIRFYDGKKCENCRIDFPDIDNGWVKADATMADVVNTMEEKYGQGQREWFGHPARLTIKGQPVEPPK